MSVSKRHHYTPRYYLKRFENEAGSLWRLDCKTGIITSGNNERFGFKNRWNTLRNPPLGYEPDWAEKQIASIDGNASNIINEIMGGRLPPDIRSLAVAISFMTHNQPHLMRELKVQHADDVGHWSDDDWLVAKLCAALDNWEEYNSPHYSVYLINYNNDARFLTSSNPLIDFMNKPSMLLPISSRHCLFLSHDPDHRSMEPIFMTCDAARVAEINHLTIKNSWKYVYSCSPNFDT